jgi:hypothetical protein
MKKVAVIGILLLSVTACAASPAPTPVELWTVGDDGLSMRLRDAIESALDSSSEFVKSHDNEPGALIVLIPTNVDWKNVGSRTQVLYKVEFRTTSDHIVAKSNGSCWDDSLGDCADQIVKGAKKAARGAR